MSRRVTISLSTLLIAVLTAGTVNAHFPAGDLTGDYEVDLADLQLMAGDLGQTAIPLTINEFMASNSNSVEDPQGDYDDWIEIHNFGADAIDVGGMYLTDDISVPTKWRIPGNDLVSTIIPAGGYLVIWADNDIAGAGLHANFKLDADGDEIGLSDQIGSTLIDSVVFAKQSSNISYGRFPDSGESWRFFPIPTPGIQNDGGYLGEVDAPKFSHKRGFYDASFYLTLATETKDATIY